MALPGKSKPSSASTAIAAGVPALCAIATELTALLERETALIRAMKLNDIGALQADKARLTKLCGTTLKTIDPAAPLAKALKDQWRDVSHRLGKAALANEMALRVGRAATDQLVGAIIGHIERRHSSSLGYAGPAARVPPATRRGTLAGVTVDRSL